MIVKLSDDFRDQIARLAKESSFRECADNLSIAHRKGVHFITGSPAIVRAIGDALGGEARGVYKQIARRHHEQLALLDLVTHYILIEPRSTGCITYEPEGSKIRFNVPFTYFSSFESIQPSRLITEDATDALILEEALRGYCYQHRARVGRSIQTRLQSFGGGGSSTADQYSDHAHRGPTFAVVDSDKRSPFSSLGSTATHLTRRAQTISQTTVASFHVLHCHELENMLPAKLIEELVHSDDSAESRKRWMDICSLISKEAWDEVRYLDFKNGLLHFDVANQEDMFDRNHINRITALCHARISCTEPKCKMRSDCNCIYVHGIGNSVLDRASKHFAKQTGQKMAEYLLSSSCLAFHLWDELLHILFSWAFAPQPVRT